MQKKYIYHISWFFLAVILFFGIGITAAVIQRKFFADSGTKTVTLEKNLPEKPAENLGEQKGATEPESEPADVQETKPEVKQNPAEALVPSFSFAILGDTQRFVAGDSNGGFQQSVRNITDKDIAFVMTVGDLLSSCSDNCDSKLEEWKKILGPLASKTYAVMGNHDRTGRNSADEAWQKVFSLPTNGPAGYRELAYSFDFQNAHFVVLNSEKPEEHVINKTQRDWLDADLKANKKENILIFFHEPAYPVSSKIGESLDAEPKERNELWNILAKYQVDAVFNGHEHIFSRRKVGNIYQFVFGNTDSFDHELPKPGVAEYSHQGKGFGVVTVAGQEITVQTYSVEGSLLNEFKL